ncbi:MAG: dTDP-4-dehydrorhamnose reductase [Planctomycetia bacterium]|nr:dTDP-4-dehydrorhamnose reductase [Planctomycetia bacterium]
MRIAILGAAGQLGRDLCPRLASLGEVIPLSRADIDLRLAENIVPTLTKHQPDVLVNCAAYNFVDKAETERDTASLVNAFGLQILAQECAVVDCKLVHFSTDYVFGQNATRATPYREDDSPGPISVYGWSKRFGERDVESASREHLVIRTCGLYGVWGSGGKGGNFVETMLRLVGEGKPIRVVHDQRCTPSYTVDVASATTELIARGATGLFHVTNSGDCTWYEFAQEIFRQSELKPDLTPIISAEYGAVAKRPAYSVLSTAKLASVLGSPLRSWQDALAAYLAERQQKPT